MIFSSVTLPDDKVKIANRLQAEKRANGEDGDDDKKKNRPTRDNIEKYDSEGEPINESKLSKTFKGLKSGLRGSKKLAISTFKQTKSAAHRMNEHRKSDFMLCIVVEVKDNEMEDRKKDLANRKKL